MKERVGEYACKWCRKKEPAIQGYPYVCQWQARGKASQRVWVCVCVLCCMLTRACRGTGRRGGMFVEGGERQERHRRVGGCVCVSHSVSLSGEGTGECDNV